MKEIFLTVSQTAAYLGVSPKTIRSWGDKGWLPCLKTPTGARRFLLSDLEEFVARDADRSVRLQEGIA